MARRGLHGTGLAGVAGIALARTGSDRTGSAGKDRKGMHRGGKRWIGRSGKDFCARASRAKQRRGSAVAECHASRRKAKARQEGIALETIGGAGIGASCSAPAGSQTIASEWNAQQRRARQKG